MVTYWQRREGLSFAPDLHVLVALIQPDGGVIGHAEAVLGTNAYPTTAWQPGEWIVNKISVSPQTDVTSVANVALSVRGESAQPIASDQGESIELGRVVVQNDHGCKIDQAADVTFGGSIKLIGFRIVQSNVVGEPSRVIMCWQSITPTPIDYTVFVHVTDARGDAFTADAQPRGGDYPTSAWIPGEQIEDSHLLPAVIDLIIKHVAVGLYRLDTGERLPIDGTHETEFVMPGL